MNTILQNMHLLSDTELRIVLVIIHTKNFLSVADLQEQTARGRQVYTALQSLKERKVIVQTSPKIIDGVRKYKWRCVWEEKEVLAKPTSVSKVKSKDTKTSNPNQLHPAVLGYVDLTNRRPKQLIADAIANTVASDGDDLDKWKSIVKMWILSGWNPNNIDGMLDMYNKRHQPNDSKKRRIISINPPLKTESEMNTMLDEYLKENGVFNEKD
jgi:predicted transcriptional regulator